MAEHMVVHPGLKVLRPASMQLSEKGTSLAIAMAAGRKGTDCKNKPYTKRADVWATVAPGSTQATTSTPVASSWVSTSAASAKSEKSELADLIAQMKSMREELKHYWAMKEESF